MKAVGFVDNVPLGMSESDSYVEIPGYTPAKNENMSLQNTRVTPGYFEAMGIPLKQGRGFTEQDDTASVRVMVVNEQMAKKYWAGREPDRADGEVRWQGSHSRGGRADGQVPAAR